MAKQGQFILVQPPDSRIYPRVDPDQVGIIFTYRLSKKVEDVCIKVGPYYSWVLPILTRENKFVIATTGLLSLFMSVFLLILN